MSARNAIVGVLRETGLLGVVAAVHQGWLNTIKFVCRLRGRSHLDVIYNEKYFAAEEDWTEPTAQAVVDIIMSEFAPRSVADVGCGTAVYLRHFQKRGVDIQGFEGSSAAIQKAHVPAALIEQCDLTRPLQPTRAYDLTICFEVAEHLPASAARVLVESLSRLSPLILFSAAQPGQGGVDHINERPWTYWAEEFKQVGFTLDQHATDKMRAAFGAQASVWWLEKNLIVVRR